MYKPPLPSPLTQGRELKSPKLRNTLSATTSPLTQGRELKFFNILHGSRASLVAPHAGA